MPNQKLTSIAAPVWITPTLGTNWSNYGSGWDPAGYWRSQDGIVFVRGLVKHTGVAETGTIFTLPVGYRPGHLMASATYAYAASGNAVGVVQISAQGAIAWVANSGGGTGVAVSLRLPPFPAQQ